MNAYRLTVTLGPGYGEAELDRLTESMLRSNRELHPVADLETAAGQLSITITYESDGSYDEAFRSGATLVGAAFASSGVVYRQVATAHLERLVAERSLQPA